MAKEKYISLNAMDKLMRKAGAIRVSEDAKQALAEALEEKALELGALAKRMAEHAGRRTVTGKDVQLALKNE
jgi:histone H3/H4